MLSWILIGAGSYVLGSIPFGYLISKTFYGIDIRQHGSGNPGATNVWRTLGKKPGIVTLLLDAFKGALPVVLVKSLFPFSGSMAVFAGLFSIVGHNWSLFLKGGGGKGVATSAGVFIALVPIHGLIALGTFLVFFLIFRRVSVGSLCASVALLISVLMTHVPIAIRITVVAASIMMLIKHIPNLKRIMAGTEPKVKFR